jgi:putative endonuclease
VSSLGSGEPRRWKPRRGTARITLDRRSHILRPDPPPLSAGTTIRASLVSTVMRNRRMPGGKRFVYVLNSTSDPNRYYTGLTSNVRARLAAHNDGGCTHTAKGRPWRAIVVVAFANHERDPIRAIPQVRLAPRAYRTGKARIADAQGRARRSSRRLESGTGWVGHGPARGHLRGTTRSRTHRRSSSSRGSPSRSDAYDVLHTSGNGGRMDGPGHRALCPWHLKV